VDHKLAASDGPTQSVSQTVSRTVSQPRSPTNSEPDPVGELFASSSVAVHVARGVLGLLLVVAGLALTSWSAWSLLLVPLGVLAWRGCPTCWTLGLIATISRRRP